MGSKNMPEIIELEDGTEREIPTEEEYKNLKAGHDANLAKREVVSKAKEVLGVEDLKELPTKIQELKELEGLANIDNIRNMRNSIKTLKAALKEKGIETDESGQVIPESQGLTADQVREIQREEIQKQQKESALANFTEEQRKVIEPQLDKAMALDPNGSLQNNLNLVVGQLFPNQQQSQIKSSLNTISAGAPRQADKKELSDDVKSGAMKAFGLTDEDFKRVNQ